MSEHPQVAKLFNRRATVTPGGCLEAGEGRGGWVGRQGGGGGADGRREGRGRDSEAPMSALQPSAAVTARGQR